MGKTGLNILILIAAVAASVFVARHIIRAGPPADPHALPAPANGIVLLQQEMTNCAEGDVCIVEDTSCGFCCHYEAINSVYESRYAAMFEQSCKNYRGENCSCPDINGYPACVHGKCVMVTWLN
jgi:hypothetical protein